MELTRMQLLKPEQTLDMILEALEDLVQYELAVVLIYDGQEDLRVSKTRGPLANRSLEGYSISLKKRADLARIVEKRRTYLFSENEEHLDTYHDVIDLPSNHSCLVSPLYMEDDLIGMLTLDHRMCNVYTPKIVRFIETLSKLISVNLVQSSASHQLYSQNIDLARERNYLMDNRSGALKQLVGDSRVWIPILDDIRLVAAAKTPVLIHGETGTGKELVARAVHQLSPRAAGPFTAVNCSTLNPSLAESELFGHERGAFTGAHGLRKGRFELADQGTLFLDEIGDIPLEIQPKLLRVLQEGAFERVGGERTIRSDVRVIAASNKELLELVRKGTFREDLYYRLSVFPVYLPPLRERAEDIMLLSEHFLSEFRQRPGYESLQISDQALEVLQGRSWPGNVRELRNVLERAVLLCRGGLIQPRHLQHPARKRVDTQTELCQENSFNGKGLDEVVKIHIERTLEQTGGKLYGEDGAARILDLKPSTLQSRMKRLGIRSDQFKA